MLKLIIHTAVCTFLSGILGFFWWFLLSVKWAFSLPNLAALCIATIAVVFFIFETAYGWFEFLDPYDSNHNQEDR